MHPAHCHPTKYTGAAPCFCDASGEDGRCDLSPVDAPGEVSDSRLIFGKSYVNPINTKHKCEITIPRLELQALVLGVKAANFILAEIPSPITTTQLWTDSSCVVGWLKNKRKQPRFVENRIEKIRAAGWPVNHINGVDNPADVASRGTTPGELMANKLWWLGPPWLKENTWPTKFTYSPGEELESRKEEPPFFEISMVQTEKEYRPIIDLTRYNSLGKAKRIIVYALRFLKGFKNLHKTDSVFF